MYQRYQKSEFICPVTLLSLCDYMYPHKIDLLCNKMADFGVVISIALYLIPHLYLSDEGCMC